MEREIARLLPQILLGMFIVGVLLFLLSLQQLRRRRTGAYWRLRRRAAERGGKLFLVEQQKRVLRVCRSDAICHWSNWLHIEQRIV